MSFPQRGQFPESRKLAEAVDALYRQSAARRDHERLVELVMVQLHSAYLIGYRAGAEAAKRKSEAA